MITTTDPWSPEFARPARLAPEPIVWIDRRAQLREEARVAASARPAPRRVETDADRLVRQRREILRQRNQDRSRRGARAVVGLFLTVGVIAGGTALYVRVGEPALERAEEVARDAAWGSTICAVAADVNARQAEALAEQDAQLRAAGVLDEGESMAALDTSRADALCGD